MAARSRGCKSCSTKAMTSVKALSSWITSPLKSMACRTSGQDRWITEEASETRSRGRVALRRGRRVQHRDGRDEGGGIDRLGQVQLESCTQRALAIFFTRKGGERGRRNRRADR